MTDKVWCNPCQWRTIVKIDAQYPFSIDCVDCSITITNYHTFQGLSCTRKLVELNRKIWLDWSIITCRFLKCAPKVRYIKNGLFCCIFILSQSYCCSFLIILFNLALPCLYCCQINTMCRPFSFCYPPRLSQTWLFSKENEGGGSIVFFAKTWCAVTKTP